MSVLEVAGVRKNFGPLVALSDVDLSVEHGQIHGLIGPNGSGKSTLLHVVAGRFFADAGRVILNGKDVTRSPAATRARQGLAIKFQLARVYRELSVSDNLLLALQAGSGLLALAASRSRRRLAAKIDALLNDFGLATVASRRAAELSHGQQQWLEIAMAIATEPAMLLLDEPTGGMSPEERAQTGVLIRRATERCGVLIVEHDLDFIRNVCDHITVLHNGVLVADGNPAQIAGNERVKEVYLTRV
jgi:ABC-type uncharacterized transport system ATPase subunit